MLPTLNFHVLWRSYLNIVLQSKSRKLSTSMTKVDIKDSKKKLQAKYYYNATCA